MLNSTRVSLFEYLGKPAGTSLGREIYKAAKREGVKTTSRDIQTKSYSGKVMLYPKGWLENYFKERGQVLTNSHATGTVSSANFEVFADIRDVYITEGSQGIQGIIGVTGATGAQGTQGIEGKHPGVRWGYETTTLENTINITSDGTIGNSFTSIHSTATACEDSSDQISKTKLKKYETRLIYRPITL